MEQTYVYTATVVEDPLRAPTVVVFSNEIALNDFIKFAEEQKWTVLVKHSPVYDSFSADDEDVADAVSES